MRVVIQTYSGVITSKDYPNKTYAEVCKIESEYMRKRGWTETVTITGHSQFKILKDKK